MRKLFRPLIMLFVLVLCLSPVCAASAHEPIILSSEEAAAANLFLSNFTETGLRACDAYGKDIDLVDFAHDHLWFNDHDSFEYGEYKGENNCRVSDGRIQEIIDKYFYDPRKADLTQTRFDYEDGYYYHCETGGWTADGFAHVISVYPIEEGKYFAAFLIYGSGYDWDNDVMDDTIEEIEAAYFQPNGYGSALIYAEDLSDRSTYRMISYSRL